MADISKQLVSEVLAASQSNTPLTIQGGGTKSFLGRDTEQRAKCQVLNVSEHSGIVNYQPVELVLTARAGTRLSEIEKTLDDNNQMLAFEPPHFGESDTLGGTLACNLSGPARPWGGSVRDHVLGIRLINGKAEHLRFGGQVMKNVAGYDVSRLQAGAMGTLGVVTEISLKVLPKHAHTVTLKQAMDAQAAIDLMNQRAGVAKPLNAACWMDGYLYIRLAGAESSVEATAKEWSGERVDDDDATEFWRCLRDQQSSFFGGDSPLWRFSVKPTSPDFALSFQAGTTEIPTMSGEPQGRQLIDWGGAQRWYKGYADWQEMQTIAAEAGGQVSIFRGAARDAEVFHEQAPALQLIQKRLKHNFDPQGLFNPGRLYHWL